MAVIPYETLASIVLVVVEENKYRKWAPAALAKEVEERSGYKGAIVGILVRAMFLAKQLNGICIGETVRQVWYKEPGSYDGDGYDAEEARRNMEEMRQKARHAEENAVKLSNQLTTLTLANDNLSQAVKGSAQLVRELQEKLKESGKEVTVAYRVTERDGSVRVVTGQFNKMFKKVLSLATKRKNIFIYGPTGTGKSFLAKQLAEVLGLRFAFVSCTTGMSEGHLGGRLLPLGEKGKFLYVISEFISAYENGGVFLLDEVDAADANVMLFINAALANGRIALSNRPDNPYAYKHKDFICIAAANTVGTGGDRMYSGRNKLDASTLDRFAVGKIYIDYDHNVESRLVETWSPNKELLEWCWKVRKAIAGHRLERAMSTRFILDAYEMLYGEVGEGEESWTQEDLEESYFAGWREDEINKVKTELRR